MPLSAQDNSPDTILPQGILAAVLDSTTDPILYFNQENRLQMANAGAYKLFQSDKEQLIGKEISELFDSGNAEALLVGELKEWVSPDQQVFVPRINKVFDKNQTPSGWVINLRDITHYRKLNRNQNEFTRIVSHDLRSPLTSMLGFANMLEAGMVGELNEKQLHFVEKILSGISQMTALVENIQDAGRYDPETGFYEVNRSPCDLGEIVKKIASSYLMPEDKQDMTLTSEIAAVPIINADVHMLERAIINLVDNAVKYTPNGGQIRVSIKRVSDQIQISVSDTGYGISPEHQKNLFDRHVRIPRQEHKKVKGSGLGLFIVRSVAQRHDGDAWVESVLNQGSTFFIGLPISGVNKLV